jgi:hypothetical protein
VPPIRRAADLALEVRQVVFGQHKGEMVRCNLEALCERGAFRVRTISSARRGSHQALLIPEFDGSFTILVDPNPPERLLDENAMSVRRHRVRFRVAHEIGHSFFYNRLARPPVRLVKPSQEEEQFCNAFAFALLVPPAALAAAPPTPEAVFRAHLAYDVSVWLAAHSLTVAHPTVSIVGLLREASPRTGAYAMRVVWSQGPRFIPRGARFPSEAVERAEQRGAAEGTESFSLKWLRGEFHVSASMLPRRRQIVAVLRAPSGPSSQLSLVT